MGKKRTMKTALTIAGSDSSGGAGLQADIKAMEFNGVYAMSAVTALTAQNTLGVQGIFDVPEQFLAQQINSVFEDIRPDAVKVGMVSSAALVQTIAERMRFYQPRWLIVDPVMVATSGAVLITDEAIAALKTSLFPLADLLTPNIPEAQVIAGTTISDAADMVRAARTLAQIYHTAVLVKGGHARKDANDVLVTADGYEQWFTGVRVNTTNTHGTGDTLASSIAANLAKGFPLPDAVARAKSYVSAALADGLDVGAGSGPMNHAWAVMDTEYGMQMH
ncbi:MAG: bifunctional hydroxymethylpyrimidine kinase/phosphomethylpyrimidine kinase [Actinomycetaceae bacterium]|nr:bifunctional hydroxymethylpyrimidine kinase/phosphomethylpyrimidine kinase [Actinomycetaceae bacterium]MDY6082891.1 bifunctional hydroxymethylpyrimidine kinase/phosphomethylpyrimidine kinase [Actinomycetaceae bacterium]